jgi:hypothetical protein
MLITTSTTETRTISHVVAMVCDLCQTRYDGASAHNWAGDSYKLERTALSYEQGCIYPEGVYTTTIHFDICPACMTTRVMPWLQSQGATPTTRESDI